MCQRCLDAATELRSTLDELRQKFPNGPKYKEDPAGHHVSMALHTAAVHDALVYYGNPIAAVEALTDIVVSLALRRTERQRATYHGIPLADEGKA